MSNDIYLIGEVGYEINLQNTIALVDKTDKEQPLNVHIHSQGGSVYDGLAIYNYLKGLPQQVNTISNGLVASIASIIFLAGNKETRKINKIDNFLIHLPMGFSGGNAKDLEKTAKEMRDIESKLAEIYANETSITKEEALELMAKDEMLDVNFLKEKGFVNDIIEFKAVANFNTNNKHKMSDNLTKTEAEGLFAKFEKTLKNIFKGNVVNKIVQDANGLEIDFVDLEDDSDVVVGERANIEGAPANGEYIMPSGETYFFTDGTLTEIKEDLEEEVEVESNEEIDALKAENEKLKSELESLKAEKESFENKIETIEADFKELKNKITSDFENPKKVKKEEVEENKSRTFKFKR